MANVPSAPEDFSSGPRVRVVVLNFNGGERLARCLDALEATNWPEQSLQIVLVDNASSDGSQLAADGRTMVTLVKSATNLGFPANNLAMGDLDDVDYVALINNDAYVEPGWLSPLVAALETDATLGAANALVLFTGRSEPTVNNAGNDVRRDGYGSDRGFGDTDLSRYDQRAEVFAWCGAAVLLRAAYLADVGLFDERFFLYYEDTDLSWRGRLRGWRYCFVPESRVMHDHSATVGAHSDLQIYYTERNRLLMLVKCAPAMFACRAVAKFALSTLSYLLRGDRHRGFIHVRSYVGFWRLAPAMLRARRRVRSSSTVSDETILGKLTNAGAPFDAP